MNNHLTTIWRNKDCMKKCCKKTEQAAYIGGELAKLAMEAGVKQVVLDRGPYKYHGRVKAFADAAREGGLEF